METPQEDTYREPSRRATVEDKVRGSRFAAEVVPVQDVETAGSEVERIRRMHFDASHHCWAYRLDPDGGTFRWNDDGEPAGSAGPPILRQIDASGLTNVLVVVTRWFGGTKLGVGGLVRAYGGAAARALEGCRPAVRLLTRSLLMQFDYADTSPAMHLVDRFNCRIDETTYGDDTRIRVAVRRSLASALEDAFVEALGGRGRIARID